MVTVYCMQLLLPISAQDNSAEYPKRYTILKINLFYTRKGTDTSKKSNSIPEKV